jgi:hypothetical protein
MNIIGPPETEIRTDLWNTMNVQELSNQRDLIITKLTLVGSMISGNATPSILGLYKVFQQALEDINRLIDTRLPR